MMLSTPTTTSVRRQRGRKVPQCCIGLLCLLLTCALGASSQSVAQAADAIRIKINAAHPGPRVPQSFLGLSIEYGASIRVLMAKANGRAAAFANLFKYLAQFNGPPIIRIGGNSEDHAAWNLPQYSHRYPQLRIDITPADARRLARIAEASSSRLILGLNLGTGTPHMAQQWVRHAISAIGLTHIRAFEIGNEPDEFFNLGGKWNHETVPMYMRRFNRMAATIMPLVKTSKLIAGPAFCCRWLHTSVPVFIAADHSRIGIVTIHYYPLGAPVKDPKSPRYATIPNLLKNVNSHMYAQLMAPAVKAAKPYSLPVRYAEMNSAYGGGKRGVSNTFASALWCTDTLFEIAHAGGAGVNFHTGSIYGAFWPSDGSGLQARPLYYGMLLFAKAVQNGGRLVPVQYKTSANVKVWACLDRAHVLRVVVINKDLSRDIRIAIPAPAHARATVESLTAPKISAITGLNFGGITFDGKTDGIPRGHFSPTPAAATHGQIVVSVKHTSAALITIRPAAQ